ncbi:hypothetical protein FACS1894162_0050 [Bacteroidia bacterium]|nr:hypothetical protein FACS1894162_0050 [Bacteroidia bacterium]
MKTKNVISVFVMAAMVLFSATSFAQTNKEVRVSLKGNAYMVGNENALGLEVNGKLVVTKNYRDFKTDDDGKYFAVEAKDGKYGVCDSKGTFIYKCVYYKTWVTGGTIRVQETASSTPKFYNTSAPTVEVKVTALDPLTFSPEIKKAHEIAERQAAAVKAQDAFASFEFKTNSKGRQELYVDGKKLYEAKTFNLISTYDFYKKTTCWVFIVTDKVSGYGKDAYGLYVLSIYNDNGKKGIETGLNIPYEYSYMSPSHTGGPVVICTTFSGAEKRFGWDGEPITGK